MDEVAQVQIRRLAKGESLPASPSLIEHLEQLNTPFSVDDHLVTLDSTLTLLDAGEIAHELSSPVRDGLSQLEIFWTVGSTNTYLIDRVDEPGFHGRVCTAEQQAAGKGRRGRSWVSPFGKNVYLSLGWEIPRSVSGVSGLSLVVGMAVAGILRRAGLHDIGLKWPNDILRNGGKLAGILVEMAPASNERYRAVVGIGINLQIDLRDARLIDQAYSTAQGLNLSRNALIGQLIDGLVVALSRFQSVGFAGFAADWPEYDLYAGLPVQITMVDKVEVGINRGVDADGNLLLETGAGVSAYNAGEVSLRPVAP